MSEFIENYDYFKKLPNRASWATRYICTFGMLLSLMSLSLIFFFLATWKLDNFFLMVTSLVFSFCNYLLIDPSFNEEYKEFTKSYYSGSLEDLFDIDKYSDYFKLHRKAIKKQIERDKGITGEFVIFLHDHIKKHHE